MDHLPTTASRDEILEALSRVPEHDVQARDDLHRRFTMAPPMPGVRMRHGARIGSVEVFENGRWSAQ